MAFVLKNFERMRGGEIFVPKIPSIKITDLAKAMAPNLKHEIIGIRPGEKIHEVMCPMDDAHLTLEFHDHYVILPTIVFSERNWEFSPNSIAEIGLPVANDFQYSSGENDNFLTIKEITQLNKKIIN